MAWVGFGLSVLIGGLLASSGAAKLVHEGFARDLANYRVMPRSWVPRTAALLPWAEIGVGVGVIATPWTSFFLLVAALLLASYAVAVSVNLLRGRQIPCGCHGSAAPISWRLVSVDVAWVVGSIWGAFNAVNPLAVLAGRSDRLSVSDAFAALIVVACGVILFRVASVSSEVREKSQQVQQLTEMG